MTNVKSNTLQWGLQLKDYIIIKYGTLGRRAREEREALHLQNCKTENEKNLSLPLSFVFDLFFKDSTSDWRRALVFYSHVGFLIYSPISLTLKPSANTCFYSPWCSPRPVCCHVVSSRKSRITWADWVVLGPFVSSRQVQRKVIVERRRKKLKVKTFHLESGRAGAWWWDNRLQAQKRLCWREGAWLPSHPAKGTARAWLQRGGFT